MSSTVTRNRTRRGDLLNTTSTPLAVPPGEGISSSSGGVRPNSNGCPLSGIPASRSKAAVSTAALPRIPCTDCVRFTVLPSIRAVRRSAISRPGGRSGSDPKVIDGNRVRPRVIHPVHALLVVHRHARASTGRPRLGSSVQAGVRRCDVGERRYAPAVVLEDVDHGCDAVHWLSRRVVDRIRADLQVPRPVRLDGNSRGSGPTDARISPGNSRRRGDGDRNSRVNGHGHGLHAAWRAISDAGSDRQNQGGKERPPYELAVLKHLSVSFGRNPRGG